MREGLIPHAVTAVMRLPTDERRAKALTELFGEIFDTDETAVAAFELEDGATWLLEAYFAQEPDPDDVRALIAGAIGDEAAAAASFESLAARDWVHASLDGLKPVRAGRFLVHGAHDRALVRVNDVAIEIEAALAFGTGHHGTTRGCLEALDATLKRRRPRAALDVGTGTGVLAIAAARGARIPVVAGDIDPVAVAVARGNLRLNRAAAHVRLYAAPGVRHALADRARAFDLVMANILARPLMRLSRDLARVTAKHGTIVLSGLLARDVAGVLSAFRGQGFRLRRRAMRDGWATLELTRPGAHPRRGG